MGNDGPAPGTSADVEASVPLPTLPALDSTVFRNVIGTITSGVIVLTTRDNGGDHGMTISAICSLSMEPPMLLVCLNTNSRTQQAVMSSGQFAVHVLDHQQAWIAERFARPSTRNKFDGVATGPSLLVDVPVLTDALAVVECQVEEAVRGGTHRVFLSKVVHAEAREGSPLAYFRGKFGRFELAQDARVYEDLRRRILSGLLMPDQELDPDQLAVTLGTGVSSVHYALTRLIGDHLVVRSEERGYAVTALDTARSDDAFDARLAIELGAAQLTVGNLPAERLAEFRALAEATIPELVDGHLVDVDAYVRATAAFHLFIVELANNAALVQAYELLSIADMMSRAITTATTGSVTPDMAEEHLALVAAYERADIAAVRELIIEHNLHARENQRWYLDHRAPRQS